MSSRARAALLGRGWPVLLMLALAWVAWLNAPSACTLEENAWREADAHLTRLMIRAHRSPGALASPASLAAASTAQPVAQQPVAQQPVAQQPVAQQPVAQQPVDQHTLSLPLTGPRSHQSSYATEELLRAKKELETSLGELRMCRQGATVRAEPVRAEPVRAERERAPGTF